MFNTMVITPRVFDQSRHVVRIKSIKKLVGVMDLDVSSTNTIKEELSLSHLSSFTRDIPAKIVYESGR